jgi:hypothetical protein
MIKHGWFYGAVLQLAGTARLTVLGIKKGCVRIGTSFCGNADQLEE